MKNLKLPLLLVLLLAGFSISGCSSGTFVSKAFINSEQPRVDSYFDARSNHIAPFNNLHFYEVSDSVAATIPPSLTKLIRVYRFIDEARVSDSLWSGTDDFPLRAKIQIDINFLEAKGVAK